VIIARLKAKRTGLHMNTQRNTAKAAIGMKNARPTRKFPKVGSSTGKITVQQ